MRKWCFIFCVGLLVSCGEQKTDFTGNTPLKINDFNKAFRIVALPLTISDSNINKFTDTIRIGRKALVQFVPDSIVEQIISTKDKKASLHPILKIEKEEEYYLLLNVKHPNQQNIAVVVFSKKNKFLGYKIVAEFNEQNKNSRFYGKLIYINKEPTFLVSENKLSDENAATYEKKGWAYSDSSFKMIFFDSNKKPNSSVIINPIDTLPMLYNYSGDYARDSKNFISIRDLTTPNKYQFFLHFERQDGNCIGELKGLLNFTKNQATYSEKGDPCIIHFTMLGNTIQIKEDGNCGNHRNMTCYFNDSYDKKRKRNKKK
ncbi:MAG: hypothetical protein NTZ82_02965 [Bacteroidetes bacterium]|nr:hypothetical protein [Bacteroidota bacterium]